MNEHDWMMTAVLNCRPVDLIAHPPTLTLQQKVALDRMKARRSSGEPLQYILETCNFMGIELTVEPGVFIPRPETEILVEQVLERVNMSGVRTGLRILELGTGSGNIAIALAKYLPDCSVTTVDIDPHALHLAKKNATANGVEEVITFCQEDIKPSLCQAAENKALYDIVISNPPYIASSQLPHLPMDVQFEPQTALDGGTDGLRFYREIIARAYLVMRSGGYILLEIGDGQREAIESIFARYHQYHRVNFVKDYVGTDRVVCAQLYRASKSSSVPRVPSRLLMNPIGTRGRWHG
jgi:release factor glutamine methyltransferase